MRLNQQLSNTTAATRSQILLISQICIKLSYLKKTVCLIWTYQVCIIIKKPAISQVFTIKDANELFFSIPFDENQIIIQPKGKFYDDNKSVISGTPTRKNMEITGGSKEMKYTLVDKNKKTNGNCCSCLINLFKRK